MRTLFLKILALLTKLTIWKFKPVIVGITGSVGKTSTKEAVAAVLRPRFTVRAAVSSYNNEFGLPLTVLGQSSPGRSLFKWLWLFGRVLAMLLGSRYPQVLVLEMGADRSGDIAKLLNLTGPIDYAIVTDIGVSHLMNYSSPDALAREKLSLIKGLKTSGVSILNIDNQAIAKYIKAKQPLGVVTYGLDQEADVAASEINISNKDDVIGLNFKIKNLGTVMPVLLPQALGSSNVYAALAAAAVGLSMKMNLVEISQALGTFQPPAGRLRLIPGIKNTKIIDDTYNAAPASVKLGLDVLSQITPKGYRKLGVLGGMAELGAHNESGHKEVAAKIVEIGLDAVYLVGENSKIIRDELAKLGYTGPVEWFADSVAACLPVQNALQERDHVLIKGSQSARMEKVVKEIMSEPLRAPELLVRQSEAWLKT
jgi:UDP-N-acetylmuramoyl-tripeptide--D-alanyl-D-alanine ligase